MTETVAVETVATTGGREGAKKAEETATEETTETMTTEAVAHRHRLHVAHWQRTYVRGPLELRMMVKAKKFPKRAKNVDGIW